MKFNRTRLCAPFANGLAKRLGLLGRALLAALLFIAPARATEQSSYQAPTAGPMSMSTFVSTYLNPALRALATCSWGTSAPANGPGAAVAAQQCWWDTSGTPYVLKWYIGAQWVAVANVNASTHAFTLPGHIIGTDVQAYNANLAAIAGLTTAANKCAYWTGSGAAALIDCLAWARTFIAAADASAGRTALGVAIGSDVQAYNTRLAAIAAFASTANRLYGSDGSGNGSLITLPAAGLTLSAGALALANDLAALEALSSTGCAARTASETWALRTITGTANQISVSNGDCVSGNPTLSIPASPQFSGAVDLQGTLKLSAFVTSTQIAANSNNYTATDGSNTCTTKLTLRVSSDASRNVTGLSCGQAEGDIRLLHNVGAQDIVLKNQDAASTDVNRFLFGGDVTLLADYSITIRYDGVTQRWRAITTATAGGGGGVTSAQVAAGNGISVSGTCTITTSGTCTVTNTGVVRVVVQTFTGSGTYTPTTGMIFATVECVGGGGGGGYASAGGGESAAGGGGGGGGYGRETYTAATIGASQTVTIGAAGAAGVPPSTAATAGGNTTFGALMTCGGGAAGASSASSSTPAYAAGGGAGGSTTGADINAAGGRGGAAIRHSGTLIISGRGGRSIWGSGGDEVAPSTAGTNGSGFGAGGSGGANQASTANGGSGSIGYLIVTEYVNQ